MLVMVSWLQGSLCLDQSRGQYLILHMRHLSALLC